MIDFHDEYVVIIADIINSKNIIDRVASQRKLLAVLIDINELFRDDLASKFSITLGDEFQGLLKSKQNIINTIDLVEKSMAPIELRFGIGVGTIDTDINMERSSEIDGPAYHRARRMIEQIRRSKSQYTKGYSNILICSGENVPTDNLLNSVLSVCFALKSKWSTRQREIIDAFLANEENQYRTAASLGIGQPSVHKALDTAKYYTYRAAIDTVDNFLKYEIAHE